MILVLLFLRQTLQRWCGVCIRTITYVISVFLPLQRTGRRGVKFSRMGLLPAALVTLCAWRNSLTLFGTIIGLLLASPPGGGIDQFPNLSHLVFYQQVSEVPA
jgi:hypothetical protein